MKVCKGCGETKPLDGFHRSSLTRDGRQGKCKSCRCAARRARYQLLHAHERDGQRAYYLANTARLKAAARRDYWDNRDARIQAHREYHRQNWARIYATKGDYYRQKARVYYRSNPERFREYNARRRAAIGIVTPEVRAWTACLLDEPCVYCGSTENIEIDHVVPLSRGGAHVADNLAPACRPCNRSKGRKLLSEWKGVADG